MASNESIRFRRKVRRFGKVTGFAIDKEDLENHGIKEGDLFDLELRLIKQADHNYRAERGNS